MNEYLLDISYDEIQIATPSIAMIKTDTGWGLFNIHSGKILLSPSAKEVKVVSASQFKIKKNNKWELIEI